MEWKRCYCNHEFRHFKFFDTDAILHRLEARAPAREGDKIEWAERQLMKLNWRRSLSNHIYHLRKPDRYANIRQRHFEIEERRGNVIKTVLWKISRLFGIWMLL